MIYDPRHDKPPLITPELMAYLEYQFKDQVPEITWDDRKVWSSVGAANVVRHLRMIQKQQEDNVLRN